MSPFARNLLVSFCLFVLASCGGKNNTAVTSHQDPGDFDDLIAYKPSSPYAENMADCVRASTDGQLCKLDTLPFIGMDVEQPTVDDIMDHVVVSHTWMGERFEEILYALPEAILPIFKAVTAVVIDDDIRPAFYTSQTGAIYLDPAYLWLSVEEKLTINQKPDYRSGYSDPLAFRSFNQYLKDGQRVSSVGSLEDDSTRILDDILYIIARLLLHELGHANDFFPPDTLEDIDRSDTAARAASKIDNRQISAQLTQSDPLTSSTMYSLAGVMFRGNTPSSADLAITATEVGEAFEPDGAADDYAYSSVYEDTAMLFEITMMKYFFDVDYDIVFTDAPEDPTYCNYYIVRWGQRNRIGDSDVKARAQYVVSELLPSLSTELFFQQLPIPETMPTDVDLCSIFSKSESGNLSKTSMPLRRMPSEGLRKPYL